MRRIVCLALLIILPALVPSLTFPTLARAEMISVGEGATERGLAVRAQSADGLDLHFGMETFGMEPVSYGGQLHRKITLSGVFLPNNPGAPDLPGLGRLMAIPRGATVSFEIVAARTQVFQDVPVAAAPVLPRDGDDAPLVYDEDPAIYTRDAFYPESPVVLSAPQRMRGIDVVTLGVTPFQYNPATRELIAYTELEVRLTFHGGSGQFGEQRLRSRHWEPLLRDHLLNYETLPPAVEQTLPAGRSGYEYVIITDDDPDFIAWADTLKEWRTLQGISTEVFTTTDIGGSTAGAIETWLNNAYTNWDTPPAAFLLLGDYPGSGDAAGITAPIWNGYCVSDNIYADVDGDDLPDMAHGRITARSAGELATMIGKMLDYERVPTDDPGFYDHPVCAGGWQTERWFILCTEVIYGHQANALGKHPVREYAIYSGTPGSVWSTAPNTSQVTSYFGPAGLDYLPTTPGHLTDWGATATRVNNDLNAGAYMLMHRDHGSETGWGEPRYTTSSLAGLNNSLLPFVFSINCLTGKYNYGGECFTEAFHRMSQGALGLIAASEVSYSFVNDTFVWGMFDGLWPDFDPGYGERAIGSSNLRTAFAHASGKYYLHASNWPYNTSNKDETNNLFHHHGDAFLTLYSEVPQALAVIHDDALLTNAETFTVQADAGAVIALTVNGAIIGVVDATGAPQEIPIVPQTETGTLRITVTKANHYRYDERIPITPGGPTVQAAFSALPISGCAPLSVTFTDESTGEVTGWAWDFGDGATSTLQNPGHVYDLPGTYTVSLTVTGPDGADTETKTNYISVSSSPVAGFSGSPTSGTAPLTVAFTDLSSGAPSAWSWDFGDGGSSVLQHPSHTFSAAGEYTVALTVTNACGSDALTRPAYIQVDPPEPNALALIDLPVAGTVTGDYTDTHASDDRYESIREVSSETHPRKWYSMLEHRWEFSVPPANEITLRVEAYRTANSEGDDFAFEYSTDGSSFTRVLTVDSDVEAIYTAQLPASLQGTVILRVVDTDHTRSNQSLETVYIDQLVIETVSGPVPPVADFSASPTSGYAPLTVAFSDLSSGAPTAWSWDFGDGGSATIQSPNHLYTTPGTYTVALTVTNPYGSDTETRPACITVLEPSTNTMHVHDMLVTRKQAGINYSGRCTIWIRNQAGQPVEGALVYTEATGPTGGSLSGTTLADGSVTLTTSKTRNPSGIWCFEVIDVMQASYTYDPTANVVTSACEGDESNGKIPVLNHLAFGLAPAGVAALDATHTVFFRLGEGARVRLDVFDVTGAKVSTLIDGWRAAGLHTASFDAARLASGLYFYRLEAGALRETRRVMVVR